MEAPYFTVELSRSEYGFGFSVSEGLNLNQPICIHQIASDGPAATGDFFEEWNKTTPQIHIRKFEEQTA